MPKLALVPKPSDEAVMEALRGSPTVARAVEERAAERLEERRPLATRLAELEHAALKTLPALRETCDLAADEIRKTERRMQGASGMAFAELASARELARGRWVQANQKMAAASLAYTSEHDELERKLRGTASPLISAFKTEMIDEVGRLRKSPIVEDVEVKRNVITDRVSVRALRSSAFSKTIRLHAILTALDDADRLVLVADQSDVPAELDRLRSSLPSADTLYPAPRSGRATSDLLADLRAGVPVGDAIKRHGE